MKLLALKPITIGHNAEKGNLPIIVRPGETFDSKDVPGMNRDEIKRHVAKGTLDYPKRVPEGMEDEQEKPEAPEPTVKDSRSKR